MSENKKIYSIQINGIEYSIKQVDALSDSLQFLDKKIKELESRSVNVSSTTSRGGGSNVRNLQTEDQLLKQIQKTEQQIADTRREDYQQLLAEKDLLKEAKDIQEQRAASERLTAGNYGNTMKGMKQELADIKSVMQTTDLGSDQFQELTTRANELTQNLKNIEESYGQYGRNVGNYANSIAEGMKQVTIKVGNTERTFSSAKEASRELGNELKTMALNGEQDTQAFKDLQEAVVKLNSDMKDATVSSKAMDNLLDTMQSFTALGSIGQGFSAFFGFDDTEIQRSIQKLVALQNVLKGIEVIRQQMKSGEGLGKLFSMASSSVDTFVAKLTGAKVTMNGLTMSTRAATVAVKGLSFALKGIGVGIAMVGVSYLIEAISNMGKLFDTTKKKIDAIDNSLNSLNRTYQFRMEELSSMYLQGGMSDEEFLTNQYKIQTDYLSEQIDLLEKRQSMTSNSNWYDNFLSFRPKSTYGGGVMNGSETVKSYGIISDDWLPSISITVENIKQVEEEFIKCQKAVDAGRDYFDMWGDSVEDFLNSLFATVGDTERVMHELGNIKLGDFLGQFKEANEAFKNGNISAEEFAAKLKEFKNQLNKNDVLKSVLANIDEYIDSDKAIEQINAIIEAIVKLDDAFNMTSPEQVRYWEQVRIDGMKEGWDKTKAQLDSEKKYEIEQHGKTKEQIELLNEKYRQKEAEARKKFDEQEKSKAEQHSREMESALKDLYSLQIANMKDGLKKQIAQLNEEKRQRLNAAIESGILVGERRAEIEKLYDTKILDARKEWAYNVEQVYKNMWKKIYDINHNNAQLDFETQLKEIDLQYQKLKEKTEYNIDSSTVTYSNRDYNVSNKVEIESEENYTKRLREEYSKRKDDRKKYFDELEKLSIQRIEQQYEIESKRSAEEQNNELRTLRNGYQAQDHELSQHLKKGELTQEEYNEAVKRLVDERMEQESLIQQKYITRAKERELKMQQEIKDIKATSYNSQINEYKEYLDKLSNIDASSPIRNEGLGFTNIAATNKRNKELINSLEQLKNDIITKKQEIQKAFDSKEMSLDDFTTAKEELESLENSINQTTATIVKSSNTAFKQLASEISQYASQLGSSLNSLVSAIGDYTDQQFENEINKLEKFINEYEEKLNEQQKITQEHASNLQSIEQELADSRGARRQALIDKLNAEMAAQRASLAEEKRIEKEKKKLEDKKEKEEKERLKAQKKVKTTQAIINGAVAFMNALATEPIWLGIAMASMTAAMTAIQLATINSAKYADGGVIQGRSHAQGGVKVLGGNAEVEGGEYITNKATTSKNVELLDYINARKKKLDLDDMIEFYSSGKGVKKTISTTRTKFADGGVIPTLRSDISVNDRLIQSFEDYSNRPVQVAVVDIMDKTQQVNNVRVMAGLSD